MALKEAVDKFVDAAYTYTPETGLTLTKNMSRIDRAEHDRLFSGIYYIPITGLADGKCQAG